MRTSLGTRSSASAILSTALVLSLLPSCRSTAPSATQSVSIVRSGRAVARCEWVAAIESLNSGATTDGVRVLKEKAAKLGANAVLMSGVLARGPQGAVAYRCEKQPKEELPY